MTAVGVWAPPGSAAVVPGAPGAPGGAGRAVGQVGVVGWGDAPAEAKQREMRLLKCRC